MTKKAGPVIKWVGGKRQLLKEIKENLPASFNQYHEPFIGGGAVFFDFNKKGSVICDLNPELTNLYEVIKTAPQELIVDLQKHQNTEEYYYAHRKLDRDPEAFNKMTNVERASRFIFLNKTGFNGLYKVNKRGEFNVAYGKRQNVSLYDEENILACSELLKETTIKTGDFETIKGTIQSGDFVYLDPPYVPLSKTSSFTEYTSVGFNDDTHIRLKEMCDYINEIGAYFMLSNSHTQFILDLYKDYNIKTVEANRMVNCKVSARGKINEVLVMNYAA